MRFHARAAGLCVAALLGCAPVALAQSTAIPPQPGVDAGQLRVTGPDGSFSANLSDLRGPWGSVTVTNTNCTTPYRPGTAQAGAVIFTAPLRPGAATTGTLQGFVGSAATGQVKIASTETGGEAVSASLSGLESFVQDTTLRVCLTLGVTPPMLADINVAAQRVAATNFDVTGVATASTDSAQPLIAISGTQPTADGANRQVVFFFLGNAYLGTDTSTPSLAPLQLTGSPGPDQLTVSYSDPAGGPSATITYTLTDGALSPDLTPPGH